MSASDTDAFLKEEMDEGRSDVGLDERMRSSYAKTHTAAAVAGPMPGRRPEFLARTGTIAVRVGDDHLRGSVQGSARRLYPRPAKRRGHPRSPRAASKCTVGKVRQELRVLEQHPSHPGLLEHHLRDQDLVGVASPAPG